MDKFLASQSNNKRIAKNTLLLYVRMIFVMGVTLYTSRVILKKLGVEDYGIMNVAGGIIAMFTFINSSMTSATQRYITFSLGQGTKDKLQRVFKTALIIHGIIALFIILLGESLGLWLLLRKLVIPETRMVAAMWVYQCSILSTVVSILYVPFNADIIAHERMNVFAYISVIEVVLKLLIVYSLVISPFDKLITYSCMLLCVQILVCTFYIIYCRQNFNETRQWLRIDRSLLKEMSGFAGWSFFGNFAAILYSQGLNLMLNIFFGPIVNAARGIAIQVQVAVSQFVASFQMAINPQITKTYSVGDLEEMHILIFRCARFSFFLLLMIAIPVTLETNLILSLWLGNIPENTVIFLRIMLFTSLLYTVINPCVVANQATGKIKKYQIAVGSILLLILPISYVFLSLGYPPYIVFIVHFCMEVVAQIIRMYLLQNLIQLPIKQYFPNLFRPITLVFIISYILPFCIHIYMNYGLIRLMIVTIISVLSVCLTAYSIGLSNNERLFVKKALKHALLVSVKYFYKNE